MDGGARAGASESLQLSWHQESEQRQWRLFAYQTGSWDWAEVDSDPEKRIDSKLLGGLLVGGTGRRYLRRDLSFVGRAFLEAGYQEARSHEGSRHDLGIARIFSGTVGLGMGIGRLRDVTPVLQAQRLSERLQALGREPLSREEVLHMASVLAQSGGYSQVFDRPNRELWGDVLEPLIARGESLTPFEVFYLSEAVVERLGSRQEGFVVDLGGTVTRETWNTSNAAPGYTIWGPEVRIAWFRNLSLDHQVSLNLNAVYSWVDRIEDVGQESGIISAGGQYLWAVADRVYWTNRLRGNFNYDSIEWVDAPDRDIRILRTQVADLTSSFSLYVENHVSLGPRASLDWRRVEQEGTGWREELSWNLGFNITYDLENALF